jgi:hypothetical protein
VSRLFEDPGAGGAGGGRRIAVAVACLLAAVVAGFLLWQHGRKLPAPDLRAPAAAGVTATPAPGARAVPRARGELEVTADVPGAVVFLDGRRLGAAPRRLELEAGAYRLRVASEGRRPFEREVQVVPGVVTRLAARLPTLPPLVRIVSDVPGATVFVDREYLGTTPLETRALAPGSHRLNVSAEGYEMYVESLELTGESRTVDVRFKQVQLDAAVDVVHRHGLGSCRGRLRATPAGLRFEAEAGGHSFEAPLAAIDALEVDYLKKNLRLKLHGGRLYNFTVAGASADPLLLFQREVEAARRRLG